LVDFDFRAEVVVDLAALDRRAGFSAASPADESSAVDAAFLDRRLGVSAAASEALASALEALRARLRGAGFASAG
jgi:hypothetical protein